MTITGIYIKRLFGLVLMLVIMVSCFTLQSYSFTDFLANSIDAEVISCGQTICDAIGLPGEHDTYQFSGSAGEAVVITAVSNSGPMCMYAELYSPSGTLIGFNSCNSNTSSLTLPVIGTYTIRVYDAGNNDIGAYCINLQFTTGRCGASISCGQTSGGNVASRAQEDSYSFSGNAGERVVITAVANSSPMCVYAELYSPSGALLGFNSCNSSTSSIALPATGTYTILVYDSGHNDTGSYTVNLQFTTGRCGGAISCGQTSGSNIASRAQEDSYSFSGNAGERVVITSVANSSPMCVYAELYSPSGALLGFNSCNSSTSSIALPATGTYTILVYDSGHNDTGGYTVNLQFTTGRCGTSISCGQTPSGSIANKAEEDSFSFTANAGEAVLITAVSNSSPMCVYAELYSPSGTLLGFNSCNSNTNSIVLPATGTYTILVYDAGRNDIGGYTLNLQFTTGRCGMPITCGQTKTGNLQSKAHTDAFSFSGSVGCSVVINATGTSGNVCTYAELFSPTGTSIGFNPCNSSTSSIPLTANGVYTVLVYDAGHNDTGSYSISLTCAGNNCPTCSYSFVFPIQPFPASGGTGSVEVSTQSGCSWTAASEASWITITSSGSGTGRGTVNFSVAANNSASDRTGTLRIANAPIPITQSGASNREVRVANASASRGSPVSVPILLVSAGNENALGFSLNFDPAQLQFVSAAVASGAAGATLNVNTSQVAIGRVGLALALPAGQAIAAGLRPVVGATFSATSSGSAASATISFDDQPIPREISDANANLLPAGYVPGTVMFTGTAPLPTVTSISPTSPTASSSEQNITISGSGFQSGLTVTVVAPDGSQSTLSGAQIQNVTTASFVMRIVLNAAGNWSLRVNNPDGGQSNTFSFTVNALSNPAPTLASLSPSSATAGGPAFTLTVTGANFTNSSVVRWNGSNRLTTFVSSTHLTATIPASDIAAAGTASVTVFNPPPGGGLSNALTFTITPPANSEAEQEPNETPAQANLLTIPGRRTGSAAVGDATGIVILYDNGDRDGIEDLFFFDLTNSTQVELTLTADNASSDLDLFLLSISGIRVTLLGASNGPTPTERIVTDTLAPGRYYVGVSAFRGSSTYTLTAAQAGTQIEIIPPNPTVNDQITARLSGVWPNTCIPLDPAPSVVGNEVQINTSNPGQFCGQAFTPWSLTVPIGRLVAGDYQVIVKHTSSSGQTELGRRSFSITPPPPLCMATNRSTVTQCAEEDNVKIDFAGSVVSYVIEATHPAYAVGTDNCAPDFSTCQPPSSGFPFTPGVFKLFDDGETVLEAVREASWWRPNGMIAAVNNNAPVSDVHYIRIYQRIAGTSEYPQVVVLYMDGNLRLIPHPPVGASSVCFGSSVIIGPAAPAPRPIAEIASVTYFPVSKAVEVKYKDGGSANIILQEVNRNLARVQVVVNYPTDTLPFATLRSMYVADDNADAGRVKWLDILGVVHDDPILTFPVSQGTEWFFYRSDRSRHNTSAPDIRIRVESRP